MKTEKLTLRLEGESIERAKRIAEERGTSVSRMVAGFFESIEEPQNSRATEEGRELSEFGEITRRLRGSISPVSPVKSAKCTDGQDGIDEQEDYRRYLERKYG